MENSKLYADSLLFTLKSDMPLLIGITAGMLIVQDFRNNTIRNKIIIGHSRTNIYLCTFIVSQTVMLIYEAAYFVTAALVGGIVLGFDKFPSGDMVGQLLMTLPVQMALTSIIVFFCNTMKNIVGIFSIALGLLNKFPKAQELVGEIVPTLQMNMILSSDGVPEHAARMIVFMIAITVVSTISGIFLFRRSDLK